MQEMVSISFPCPQQQICKVVKRLYLCISACVHSALKRSFPDVSADRKSMRGERQFLCPLYILIPVIN